MNTKISFFKKTKNLKNHLTGLAIGEYVDKVTKWKFFDQAIVGGIGFVTLILVVGFLLILRKRSKSNGSSTEEKETADSQEENNHLGEEISVVEHEDEEELVQPKEKTLHLE